MVYVQYLCDKYVSANRTYKKVLLFFHKEISFIKNSYFYFGE